MNKMNKKKKILLCAGTVVAIALISVFVAVVLLKEEEVVMLPPPSSSSVGVTYEEGPMLAVADFIERAGNIHSVTLDEAGYFDFYNKITADEEDNANYNARLDTYLRTIELLPEFSPMLDEQYAGTYILENIENFTKKLTGPYNYTIDRDTIKMSTTGIPVDIAVQHNGEIINIPAVKVSASFLSVVAYTRTKEEFGNSKFQVSVYQYLDKKSFDNIEFTVVLIDDVWKVYDVPAGALLQDNFATWNPQNARRRTLDTDVRGDLIGIYDTDFTDQPEISSQPASSVSTPTSEVAPSSEVELPASSTDIDTSGWVV